MCNTLFSPEGINQEIYAAKSLLNSKHDELDGLIVSIHEKSSEIEVFEQSIKIISTLVEKTVMGNSEFVQNIVNRGLEYIFMTDYAFVINHSIKQNKNIFSYTLEDKKSSIVGDINNFGGGIMATVSFLLRVSINILQNKPKIMMMDESLNHVSESYQGKLSNFIKVLCDEFNMTIVLVTHQDRLTEYADQIVHFEKEGSELKVVNQ